MDRRVEMTRGNDRRQEFDDEKGGARGATRGRAPDISGGHRPVLLAEALRILAPRPGERVVDGTLGGGGHAETFLDEIETSGLLLGIDWDEDALTRARERLAPYGERARLVRGNFAEIDRLLAKESFAPADVIFLDLGLSAFHVEDPARGFSFMRDGPLDMRMDRRRRETARQILAERSEKELADIIFTFGEEKASRKIARAVVEARKHGGLKTTGEFAALVARVLRRQKRGRIHPATRSFQALRIEVNQELENIKAFLAAGPDLLAPGGRVGVIAFHSLEDRLVKRAFRARAAGGEFRLLTKKAVQASEDEQRANPRSRSARLRVLQKCGAEESSSGEIG